MRVAYADAVAVDVAAEKARLKKEIEGLQKAIARKEIAGVSATTSSVLETSDSVRVQTFRTTIAYFFHDGTRFSDAISLPAEPGDICGYWPIPMDDVRIDRLVAPAMFAGL